MKISKIFYLIIALITFSSGSLIADIDTIRLVLDGENDVQYLENLKEKPDEADVRSHMSQGLTREKAVYEYLRRLEQNIKNLKRGIRRLKRGFTQEDWKKYIDEKMKRTRESEEVINLVF